MAEIIINLESKNEPNATSSKRNLPCGICTLKSSFSNTNNQLATTLGFCIATNLQTIARQNDVDLKDMTISITKYLKHKPVQTSCINVEVILPLPIDGKLQRKFERAIKTCPALRTVNPGLNVRTLFKITNPLLESTYG